MEQMRVLITGGAGFVGSHVAEAFSRRPGNEVVVLDNLRRRGSEINLSYFQKMGIRFCHGDIRQLSDLQDLPGNFDLIVEASAEPSVHAGLNSSPAYAIETNLSGTINCLEFSRTRAGSFAYLSTSRVYSIASLRQIRLVETSLRFEINGSQDLPGISESGIAEDFPTNRARSFYGATKLASEIMIQEYAACGLQSIINRCGIIAGPGQFGKVDQGVVSLWVARHYFGLPLTYQGFGGTGKQVRDLLHPSDLVNLLVKQLDYPKLWDGTPYNVGGGLPVSVSLKELTGLCREVVGRAIPIGSIPDTSSVDVPLYVTDYRKAGRTFGWEPKRNVKVIVSEIHDWLRSDDARLRQLFCE